MLYSADEEELDEYDGAEEEDEELEEEYTFLLFFEDLLFLPLLGGLPSTILTATPSTILVHLNRIQNTVSRRAKCIKSNTFTYVCTSPAKTEQPTILLQD